VGLTSDGASHNRRFFEMHRDWLEDSGDGVVYKVTNPFDDGREIFFFSDPPHLIKTGRNSLLHSSNFA